MEKLKKASFIISLLGIFILLFISNIEIKDLTKINKIDYKMLNKKVKVEGKIDGIRNINENFQIISLLEDNKKIDVLTNKELNIKEGDFIQVIGRVTEYNKTLQIQSDKIILFNISR